MYISEKIAVIANCRPTMQRIPVVMAEDIDNNLISYYKLGRSVNSGMLHSIKVSKLTIYLQFWKLRVLFIGPLDFVTLNAPANAEFQFWSSYSASLQWHQCSDHPFCANSSHQPSPSISPGTLFLGPQNVQLVRVAVSDIEVRPLLGLMLVGNLVRYVIQ